MPRTDSSTSRASAGSPDVFDWSSVPFQIAIAIRSSPSRDAHASTSDPPPSPDSSAATSSRPSISSSRTPQNLGLRRLPIVSSPNPPWKSRSGSPSSTKWSLATQ
jgi:hypothetical protein